MNQRRPGDVTTARFQILMRGVESFSGNKSTDGRSLQVLSLERRLEQTQFTEGEYINDFAGFPRGQMRVPRAPIA